MASEVSIYHLRFSILCNKEQTFRKLQTLLHLIHSVLPLQPDLLLLHLLDRAGALGLQALDQPVDAAGADLARELRLVVLDQQNVGHDHQLHQDQRERDVAATEAAVVNLEIKILKKFFLLIFS